MRVRAVALNALDWYFLTGTPYFARMLPKRRILCVDLAGTVDAVGRGVTSSGPGDEVFGVGRGALAEHVCTRHEVPGAEAAAADLRGGGGDAGGRAHGGSRVFRDHGRLRPASACS